ncbi:MAG: trigger factor [Rhizobiaceae bacterium]
MQVTETLNQGLKRAVKVVVSAKDMESRLAERLESARGKAKINGFRPGKVPTAHLRKMYGKSFMAELVNEMINEQAKAVPAGRGEKVAMKPEVQMTEDEAEAAKILEGKADFAFDISYEVLPTFKIAETSTITISRPIVEISDEEVDEQVKRVAESARTYAEKKGKAATGDRVTMDYLGKVDGVPFDGGKDEGANLVLGSRQFIPGFEDQLIGAKAGDEKQIKVTFPENYGAANLAGKDATFDVTIKAVAAAEAQVFDDELAKKLGIESMDRLRQVIREQIESQYGSQTRQKVKRQLLDQLDALHQFESPSKLVDAEFNNIWQQITRELETAGKSFADEETTEEEARNEYRKLAERRVRLGLVLSEIGSAAGVEVTEQELQRAMYDQVRQYRGQEQAVYDFFRNNPDAIAGLRAPIFEEKVVDKLLGEVKVTDVVVSKEALMADDEEDASAEKTAKAKKAPAKKSKKDTAE